MGSVGYAIFEKDISLEKQLPLVNKDCMGFGIDEKDISLEKQLPLGKELDLAKVIFYNTSANTKIRLKDGRILKFHKESLAVSSRSEELYQILILCPELTDIPDFDYDTFKLFVDCTMNFEPCTIENAIKIFPVVWKYQSGTWICKCMNIFFEELKKLSEKASCEILNLIATCHLQKPSVLGEHVTLLFKNRFKLLEENCELLKPCTIKLLLENMEVDSYVLKITANWASEYLKSWSPTPTLKSYLKAKDLLKFFDLNCFESREEISEFYHSKPGREVFSDSYFLVHLLSNNIPQVKSEWKVIKKNKRIEEEITMPMMSDNSNPQKFGVQIGKNKVVFYDNVFNREAGNELIHVKIIYTVYDTRGNFQKHTYADGQTFSWNANNYDRVFLFNSYFRASGSNYDRCVLKLDWTFRHDCRVLLMGRQGDSLNGSENLYFSKDVMPLC